MKTNTTKEIIDKIIGRITPVGETNEDKIRYRNLEELIEIVGLYVAEIYDISMKKDRIEDSIKNAGTRASKFMDMLKDYNE